MRISKRWSAIFTISICQLLLLIGGLLLFERWMSTRLAETLREQVLADNRLIADSLSQEVQRLQLHDLAVGGPDWQRLQDFVKTVRLPNEGFMCVIENEEGFLICHPEIEINPALGGMRPGRAELIGDNTSRSIASASLASEQLSSAETGWAQMPDGIHLIAVRSIDELGISILVHQRESAVQRSVAEAASPIAGGGAILAALIVLVSMIANFVVLATFDSQLAKLNRSLSQDVQHQSRALMRTRNAVIFGLAKLSESRDTDTGTHLDRIREYTVVLAESMAQHRTDIDPQFIRDLGLASSLHDIGKVGIPDNVLLKPGPLSAEERVIINFHPRIGGDCLASIQQELGEDDFLAIAKEVAYHHHERWDGTGYPFGLAGAEIPLAARIVAVADVYDALTTKRPYKQAMTHRDASAIIAEGSGTHFDPEIVEAFIANESAFRAIKEKYGIHDDSASEESAYEMDELEAHPLQAEFQPAP